MSKFLQHSLYTGKALENQWINNIFQSHDLFCGCPKPIRHLLCILNKQGNCPKPEDEIKNIECLITGEKDDFNLDDISPGELEQLFAEEGDGDGEKDTENPTG